MCNFSLEWTIVQVSSRFNVEENVKVPSDKWHTNPLHISVFNCGDVEPLPFCITTNVPYDMLAEKIIEINEEMKCVIEENKTNLNCIGNGIMTHNDKKLYCKKRLYINSRIRVRLFIYIFEYYIAFILQINSICVNFVTKSSERNFQ